MKSYLVPIDFSGNADRALMAAKTLAKNTGGHLYVLNAYQIHFPEVGPGGVIASGLDDYKAQIQKNLQQYVDALKAEGFSAEAVLAQGQVAEVVKQKIEQLNPDLVVIGRTGKGGFLDKLFGTSASDIVKISKVPVLMIPPQSEPKKFEEIVYATQLEYEERHVIDKVLRLSRDLGGRITFLKVSALTQPNIQDDTQYIEEIASEFGLTEDDFVLKDAGSITGGIEKEVKELGADLLVVATRSRGILEKILIDPSVTSKLIVSASVPLLIYHLD